MINDQVSKAVQVLKQGKVIAYPTETVYSLGADIFNDQAVGKVFDLKGRDYTKPLLVAVSDFEMLEQLVDVGKGDLILLKKLLPGPVAVLLPKKQKVTDLVTANSSKVGIRMPDNDLAREIIKEFGPITSTSVNLAGKEPVTRAEDIDLPVDYIIKGECEYCESSTLVDLETKKILRKGIDYKKVQDILDL